MALIPVTPRERRLFRVGVAAWVGVWVTLGILTAAHIHRLSALSDTMVESGEALDTAGRALEALGGLPVVGRPTTRLADRVRAAASDIEDGGRSSREAIDWLSVLLGLALVVLPVTSVFAAGLPHRLATRRDRRAVAQALAQADRDPGLEEFLARRAVHHLPYDTLRRITADPWHDLRTGAFRHLANAELTRLGLTGRHVTPPSHERASTQTKRR